MGEKLADILRILKRDLTGTENEEVIQNIQSYYISIDPERDTPELAHEYVQDYSTDIIGLSGSYEQVDSASKQFRIYYSKAPGNDPNDYLVDHTICIYLMDPNGEFIEYFMKKKNAVECSQVILRHIDQFHQVDEGKQS